MRHLLFYVPVIILWGAGCTRQDVAHVQRITLNENDRFSGSYLVSEPASGPVVGALVLIAGFGQRNEDTFPETRLEDLAREQGILTVSFASGNKLYADSITQQNLTAVIEDVIKRYGVDRNKFVVGGFSAGGMVALRYTELCNEFPDRFPIRPRGVFMVDSPIDIFTIWQNLQDALDTRYSDAAIEEAQRAMSFIRDEYGEPDNNIPVFAELTAFSMDSSLCDHEKFLRNTPVRAYHDVDIPWRLTQRRQPVKNSNYEVTAELINRLLLMGNDQAEFMQTTGTGFRADGTRHPHSWSIVDEPEFMTWIKSIVQ